MRNVDGKIACSGVVVEQTRDSPGGYSKMICYDAWRIDNDQKLFGASFGACGLDLYDHATGKGRHLLIGHYVHRHVRLGAFRGLPQGIRDA
jgi:hypothetical protein